jgi:hypothetical protein
MSVVHLLLGEKNFQEFSCALGPCVASEQHANMVKLQLLLKAESLENLVFFAPTPGICCTELICDTSFQQMRDGTSKSNVQIAVKKMTSGFMSQEMYGYLCVSAHTHNLLVLACVLCTQQTSYVLLQEVTEVSGGRGTANLVAKCKGCKRENKYVVLPMRVPRVR